MPDPYVARLLDYNVWANRELLRFVATLPETALDATTTAGVFGTVRQTLEHMLSSELLYERYLERLSREGVIRPEHPSLPELQAIAAASATNLSRIVNALPDPAEKMQLRDGLRSAGTIFVQLLSHSAEHRTHVCTILGSLGHRLPELDSWSHGIFVNGDDWPEEWGEEPADRMVWYEARSGLAP
ncbi:MAG: DinB family protein [bacterium]